jgi:DNA-binding NarL/FixJ family response regulator
MKKEIARKLGATERTIKAHRHDVMAKVQETGEEVQRATHWMPLPMPLENRSK